MPTDDDITEHFAERAAIAEHERRFYNNTDQQKGKQNDTGKAKYRRKAVSRKSCGSIVVNV
jgi:hypothetical protein